MTGRGLIMSFFESFAYFWKLGGAVGACAVFRLCNNACYVKMASIDTAVRTRERLRFKMYQSRLNHKKRKYNRTIHLYSILDPPAPRNSVTCYIFNGDNTDGYVNPLKRRLQNNELLQNVEKQCRR